MRLSCCIGLRNLYFDIFITIAFGNIFYKVIVVEDICSVGWHFYLNGLLVKGFRSKAHSFKLFNDFFHGKFHTKQGLYFSFRKEPGFWLEIRQNKFFAIWPEDPYKFYLSATLGKGCDCLLYTSPSPRDS